MRLSRLTCLLAGSLLIFAISCRSPRPEIPATSSTGQTYETSPPPPANPLPTPVESVEPAITDPFVPTMVNEPVAPTFAAEPVPVLTVPAGWEVVGGSVEGGQVAVPETWVDLAALLDSPEAITRLGPTIRLAARVLWPLGVPGRPSLPGSAFPSPGSGSRSRRTAACSA